MKSRRKRKSNRKRMPEEGWDHEWHDERAGAILGGAILITIGSIFLANTMGWLPWSFWETISKLWPLILIIVGFWLIAKYFTMR